MNLTPFRFSAALLLLASATTSALAAPASADIVVSDDFESVAVGAIPAGFTKTGAISVAEGVAHSGKRALQVEPAVKGGRFITLAPDKVAALGGEHWGRLYFKVKTPAPLPAPVEGKKGPFSIHTTLVAGKTTSPLANDAIEVRMAGFSLNGAGEFKYLYNVQPKLRKEFGVKDTAAHKFDDEWTLLEWHVDHATQSYELFVNGKKTEASFEKGAGKFEGSEIPAAFQTLSIGWTNYQPAMGEGFTVWIDDIAVGKKRLGPVAAAHP